MGMGLSQAISEVSGYSAVSSNKVHLPPKKAQLIKPTAALKRHHFSLENDDYF